MLSAFLFCTSCFLCSLPENTCGEGEGDTERSTFLSWRAARDAPRTRARAQHASRCSPARPLGVEFDNDYYTNPKYAGTVWCIADHLKEPSKPIIPLALVQPQRRQLDAMFIDGIAEGENFIQFDFESSYLNGIRALLQRNWFQSHLLRSGIPKKINSGEKI